MELPGLREFCLHPTHRRLVRVCPTAYCPTHSLRTPYARSSTDLRYRPTHSLRTARYTLRTPYALSGTDLRYAPTSCASGYLPTGSGVAPIYGCSPPFSSP
eukprot:1564436-Rhodomonas_salina.1